MKRIGYLFYACIVGSAPPRKTKDDADDEIIEVDAQGTPVLKPKGCTYNVYYLSKINIYSSHAPLTSL